MRPARKFAEKLRYLQWLSEDGAIRKAMLFDRMSKGWAIGTKDFKEALLKEEKNLKACLELGVDEAKEMRESAWGSRLAGCLKVLGKSSFDIESDLKSASWKIAVAGYMKKWMLCRNGWLADRLGMGTESAVARYSSELFRGERKAAEKDMKLLMTKVLD